MKKLEQRVELCVTLPEKMKEIYSEHNGNKIANYLSFRLGAEFSWTKENEFFEFKSENNKLVISEDGIIDYSDLPEISMHIYVISKLNKTNNMLNKISA